MKKERFTDGLQHIQTGDTHQPEKEAGEKMVTLHRIEKNNGKILDAVTIMESGTHIAPTIYLADFYDFFSHGMSLEEVTLKILELNTERQVEETEFQNAGFEDYKRARSHICYKLINLDMNRKLLKNVPYIPYLDLAIVFYYRLEEEVLNGANFLVHNCNLESWGLRCRTYMRMRIKIQAADSPLHFREWKR